MIVPHPLNPSELITVIFIIRRKVFGKSGERGRMSTSEGRPRAGRMSWVVAASAGSRVFPWGPSAIPQLLTAALRVWGPLSSEPRRALALGGVWILPHVDPSSPSEV